MGAIPDANGARGSVESLSPDSRNGVAGISAATANSDSVSKCCGIITEVILFEFREMVKLLASQLYRL